MLLAEVKEVTVGRGIRPQRSDKQPLTPFTISSTSPAPLEMPPGRFPVLLWCPALSVQPLDTVQKVRPCCPLLSALVSAHGAHKPNVLSPLAALFSFAMHHYSLSHLCPLASWPSMPGTVLCPDVPLPAEVYLQGAKQLIPSPQLLCSSSPVSGDNNLFPESSPLLLLFNLKLAISHTKLLPAPFLPTSLRKLVYRNGKEAK